jgi:hypothetical protein
MHHVQRDGGGVAFDFLAECIRQPAEAAHAHPHLEVCGSIPCQAAGNFTFD